MFSKKQKKEKEPKGRKESKIAYDLNAAVIAGKDEWRSHTEVMQWLSEAPVLLDKDIALLTDAIKRFRGEGGIINFDERIKMWSCEYNNITIRIQFNEKGKIKYRAMEDTNLGQTPKDVIIKIGLVVSAHHELDKRLFARKICGELISYLEDHSTKESIDNHILKLFKDNVEVLWNSINGTENVFDVDLKQVTKEWEV
jgi:hypothetical protein